MGSDPGSDPNPNPDPDSEASVESLRVSLRGIQDEQTPIGPQLAASLRPALEVP